MFEVLLPVRKLSKEVKVLLTKEREMVTKRKEIEAQYFQGKIDEPTFRKMLVGEQNKILSTKAKAIEKAKERQQLIKKMLSPASTPLA